MLPLWGKQNPPCAKVELVARTFAYNGLPSGCLNLRLVGGLPKQKDALAGVLSRCDCGVLTWWNQRRHAAS